MAAPGVLGNRVEINLCRLLTRCEGMAVNGKHDDWRLEKYIDSLFDYLVQLRKMSANCPPAEVLNDYARRIDLLRGITEANKLSSAVDRSQAVDLLIPSNPTVVANSGSRNLHAQTKARFEKEMRDELLLDTAANDVTVRQRNVPSGNASLENGDVDTVIRHHAEMQERIAEEMLHLARNLKENIKASGHIVREDNEKLRESSQLVDNNYGKLKGETARLDTHVKRACSSWILVVLVIVILTFIWMVIFMKMFPKKVSV